MGEGTRDCVAQQFGPGQTRVEQHRGADSDDGYPQLLSNPLRLHVGCSLPAPLGVADHAGEPLAKGPVRISSNHCDPLISRSQGMELPTHLALTDPRGIQGEELGQAEGSHLAYGSGFLLPLLHDRSHTAIDVSQQINKDTLHQRTLGREVVLNQSN